MAPAKQATLRATGQRGLDPVEPTVDLPKLFGRRIDWANESVTS